VLSTVRRPFPRPDDAEVAPPPCAGRGATF